MLSNTLFSAITCALNCASLTFLLLLLAKRKSCIEVFGGNGAIETFSVLPRLYRDMLVLESWEGTHNVLCLQVLRDIARYQLDEPYFHYLRDQLASVTASDLLPHTTIVHAAVDEASKVLQRVLSGDSLFQQAHACRTANALIYMAQAALMLTEAQWELENGLTTVKPDVIAYFINHRLTPGYDPLDDGDYLRRLQRLTTAYPAV